MLVKSPNEGFWNLSELILHHLSAQDLGALRLTCQHFKVYLDSQKFWHEKLLVAILKKTKDTDETEIIQKVLATKDVNRIQELAGFYLRMKYKRFKSSKRHTPLWQLAAQKGHLEVFEFCWNWSDSKVFRARLNNSALHMSAEHGHIDVVRFLFERIKDKNPQDNHGRTPLDWATRCGHTEIVRFLSV